MTRLALTVLLMLTLLHGGCGDPPAEDTGAKAVERLKTALGDADRGVRYAAVTALGKAGEATETLGPLLHDAEWCVRQEAAWWLRQEGAEAVPVLQDAFARGTSETRASVAWAMSGLGAEAVPLLEKALRDAELPVRLEALSATRRLGAPDGGPLAEVVRGALDSDSYEERYEAALALSEVAPSDAAAALPVLVQEANEKTLHSDWEALKALLKCGATDEVLAGLDEAAKKGVPRARTEVELEARRRERRPAPLESARSSCPESPEFVAAPDAAERLGSGEPRERIVAALDLGRAGADAGLLAPALRDRERDVRLAVAMGLGTANGSAEGPLRNALADTDWRVRAAAIRSMGQHRVAPDLIAPLLADPVFGVALAAHDALRMIGPAAALPVARQMDSADYAVLHYAVSIFDGIGTDGGSATGALSDLLAHSDPNVREAAARCLTALGTSGKGATSSLVRALGDERLNVVSHAALALGAQGLSAELLAALNDPRARVRAYAAFAVGWALGAARSLDQVRFEVRLPILAVRESSNAPSPTDLDALDDMQPAERVQVLLRGIWSADPAVSVRCASLLEYEQLDAVESERVMELLLPEGLRRGSVVEFDRMRSTIGSSELCACMTYMVRARRTDPERDTIFSHFHRIARAEHLSPLCWFRRTHEEEALEGDGYAGTGIWMPATYTTASARERATLRLGYDPGPDEAAILRALLYDWLSEPEGGLAQPELWLLNRFLPSPEDSEMLLRVARALEGGEDWHSEQGAYLAALRALGRCSDAESLGYLRGVASKGDAQPRYVALAALTRRGDEESRRLLIELSRAEQDAFLVLMEVAPQVATGLLADLLVEPETVLQGLALLQTWSFAATVLGVVFPPEAFLGLEFAIAASALEPMALGLVAILVPGCRTRRVADLLFDRLEVSADVDPFHGDEESVWDPLRADEVGALLHAADPERCLLLLRTWATADDEQYENRIAWARSALLRLTDKPSAKMLIEWLTKERPDSVDDFLVERLGGPLAEAFFREMSFDKRVYAYVRDGALETLARMRGWPAEPPLSIEHDFPDEQHQQIRDWLREGKMDEVRAAFDAARRDSPPEPEPVLVWERLLAETRSGDAQARAALWSVLRAGRYRWCQRQDDRLRTLGADWTTLPHWVSDLDSNCCRVSDGLDAYVFEGCFGAPEVWGTEHYGVGQPLSQRTTTWLIMMGGRWIYSPLVERWVPDPE